VTALSLYGHIGCCVDETPASMAALEHARELWVPGEGVLSLVHVAPVPLIVESVDGESVASPRDINAQERAWLDDLARTVPGAVPVLLEGRPGPEIARWAGTAGVDLLVAARHHGGWGAAVLGSVTRHLVDHAPCPVLVVRPDAVADAIHPPTRSEPTA
jgi:nucleotide-binding universal stress UspA family protein